MRRKLLKRKMAMLYMRFNTFGQTNEKDLFFTSVLPRWGLVGSNSILRLMEKNYGTAIYECN